MPPLKNPNHEKLARAYAHESMTNSGKVVKTKVYQKVYKESTYNSARASASQMLSRPIIQARIQEIIGKNNTPDQISENLADLRVATRQVFDPEGNLVEVKDNNTRLGAVQTCLKVMGAFQEQPVQDNRQITFNIGQDTAFFDRLSNTIEKLSGLNERLGSGA